VRSQHPRKGRAGKQSRLKKGGRGKTAIKNMFLREKEKKSQPYTREGPYFGKKRGIRKFAQVPDALGDA